MDRVSSSIAPRDRAARGHSRSSRFTVARLVLILALLLTIALVVFSPAEAKPKRKKKPARKAKKHARKVPPKPVAIRCSPEYPRRKLGQQCDVTTHVTNATCCDEWMQCLSNTCVANTRVLFVGNSFTGRNDLGKMWVNVARSRGKVVGASMAWKGSATFQDHVTVLPTLGTIYSKNWTAVVLQEQSEFLSMPPAKIQQLTLASAKILYQAIKSIPTTRAILFNTWGYLQGTPWTVPGDDYYGMQNRLYSGVSQVRDYLGGKSAVEVAWVGRAWEEAYAKSSNPQTELYDLDDRHPTVAGTYLAALVFYAQIFNESPLSVSYVPKGVSAPNAARYRQYAHNEWVNYYGT